MKLAETCIKLTVKVRVKGTQLDLTKRFSNKTIFCKYSNQLHLILLLQINFLLFFLKKKRKKKKKKEKKKKRKKPPKNVTFTPNISLNLCFLI